MAGVLFIVPGVIAIMALSCDLCGVRQRRLRRGPVLRPEGRGARHRDAGCGARRQTRAAERVMIALAALAFVAIFFFGVPFPLIIIAAGARRLRRRARAGGAEFAAVGHGRRRQRGRRRQPARRGRARSRAADVGPGAARRRRLAALWLVPVGAARRWRSAPRTSSARSRSSSARWRWSRSAAPTRCWPMSRSRPSRHYRWLQPRRDARRPRHGGDHARSAHHGRPVRRLHGRLPRCRRALAAARRRPSVACSPPG